MKELYTKPEVVVDEYETVDVVSTSPTGINEFDGDDDTP